MEKVLHLQDGVKPLAVIMRDKKQNREQKPPTIFGTVVLFCVLRLYFPLMDKFMQNQIKAVFEPNNDVTEVL